MDIDEVNIYDSDDEDTEVSWDSCEPWDAFLVSHCDLLLAHFSWNIVEDFVRENDAVAEHAKGDEDHAEKEHLPSGHIVFLRHDLMNDEHNAVGTHHYDKGCEEEEVLVVDSKQDEEACRDNHENADENDPSL